MEIESMEKFNIKRSKYFSEMKRGNDKVSFNFKHKSDGMTVKQIPTFNETNRLIQMHFPVSTLNSFL